MDIKNLEFTCADAANIKAWLRLKGEDGNFPEAQLPEIDDRSKLFWLVAAEKIGELKDITDLLIRIESYLRKVILVTGDQLSAIATYVLLTWQFDQLEKLPYLIFSGKMASGKTTAINRLGYVVYRGFNSCEFNERLIEKTDFIRGTLLMDEAAIMPKKRNTKMFYYLKNGTLKNCPIWSVVEYEEDDGSKRWNYEKAFDIFCPKIFAVMDYTKILTGGQILKINMKQAWPNELTAAGIDWRWENNFMDETRELRCDLLRWRMEQNPDDIKSIRSVFRHVLNIEV